MRASVPQDVDLEDRLIFGLTPVRFGYLVVAVLGAMSLWGLHWLPVVARLVPCLLLIGAAAALAWGRWRGRPLDRLVVDVAVFLRRNYRLQVVDGFQRRARLPSPPMRPAGGARVNFAAINVLGRREYPADPGEPE
jgi:hypothetical protein